MKSPLECISDVTQENLWNSNKQVSHPLVQPRAAEAHPLADPADLGCGELLSLSFLQDGCVDTPG